MTHKWSGQSTLNFVEEYGKHLCLWHPEDQNYKNKHVRDVALSLIADAMNIEDFGAEAVRKKIRIIRSTYWNEQTKILKSKRSGLGSAAVYKPKIAWFNVAHQFLATVTNWRESQSNLPPGNSNQEKHVERPHVFSEHPQQNSPAMPATNSGVKRSLDNDGATWNQGSNSLPASEYSILQDSPMQANEEVISIKSHEDSSTFIQEDKYIDEDPLMNASDWQPPPTSRIPRMRSDSDSIIGLAYEELAKFKQLFFSGSPELKEHDQFGLTIAEDMRAVNNPYYVAMAKMKIRQAIFEIQKLAFSSDSSKITEDKDDIKPSFSQPSRTTNYEDNVCTESSRNNMILATSLYSEEEQAPVGPILDADTNGASILPLEQQNHTLESIYVNSELPLEVEWKEEAQARSEGRPKTSTSLQSSRVLHQAEDSCTKRQRTSDQLSPHGGEREIPRQKPPFAPPPLNVSSDLMRARPPASAAVRRLQQQQPPVLSSRGFTTTTMTMTTTTTTMATTTTNSGHARPSSSFGEKILTSPIRNPDAPDPPRLPVDLQNSPFETVMVKEEVMETDFSEKMVGQ